MMMENNIENELASEVRVIQTDIGAKDGQNKCPKCGATEIILNTNTGKLRCEFCRHEFDPESFSEIETDITQLQEHIIGSGAQNIEADTNDAMTYKCSSCGAEVVVDTVSATNARCHWCRNILSVNQQIPNGTIPDAVLPFQVTKDDAKREIENFVKKRNFFAHPKFKAEFTTENIMGVYFPYMIVDINSHAKLIGKGETLVRKYTQGSGDNQKYYYDADLYEVEREYDLTIHGLTIESNSERINNQASDKTNNIINAIMPFDIENCTKYNANYLRGYTSEKRDMNVEQLAEVVSTQAKNIAKFAANDTIAQYDRGVAWDDEQFQVKGQQWMSAYLPVWLYSYQQVKGNKKVLHYVAVNGRTKETMGSVPIYFPKLIGVSIFVELLGILAMLLVDSSYNRLFLLLGVIYFIVIFLKYRNSNARHRYEVETKTQMLNLQKSDYYITRRTGLSSSTMVGANNKTINSGQTIDQVLDSITENSVVANFIQNNREKDR